MRTLPPSVVTALVTLLLALQWWMGVSATTRISTTTDELAHVAGGYAYWTFDDYRLQPENGNLPQRLAGLPWVLSGARIDIGDTRAWQGSNVWLLGHNLFYESGNNTDYLLLWSRAIMALSGTALGLLIFAWSRRLWGDIGGLLSLSLYAFSPNFLANAPLAASDVTGALALLAACGAWWRHSRRLDSWSLVLSLAAVALATVSKFSFVLLLPIVAVLVIVRLLAEEPLEVGFGRRTRIFSSRAGKLGVLAGSALVHVVVAWAVIWAFFGFRYAPTSPALPLQSDYYFAWSLVLPAAGFWHWFFETTRNLHLLPDAFLNGFATVIYASAERGAFLNGEYSTTGWPQFFPYAFLVKTPWPTLFAGLITVVVGIVAWIRPALISTRSRVRSGLYRTAPLLTLFAIYWAFSVTSHLNIGLRHILPTYPVLFIGAGILATIGFPRWLAMMGFTLAAWNAGDSLWIRPHYLAYFNDFADGPTNGWRHLVDSSLDWGQDLSGLAKWLARERRPGEQVYLAYFGSGDPAYEGIDFRDLTPVYNFEQPRHWTALGPGLYCVTATMLQDTYSGWRGPWDLGKEATYQNLKKTLSNAQPPTTEAERNQRNRDLDDFYLLRYARLSHYLKVRQPDAVIGYSIFIFRLNAEEVRTAVSGDLSELADAMGKAIAARQNASAR